MPHPISLSTLIMLVFVAVTNAATAGIALGKTNVHPLYLDDDTLGSDYTNTVVRTADGYLWIGTDNGLKRYDGYQLRNFVYQHDDLTSIGTNSISTLLVDDVDNLWVGGHVLSRYHSETESFENYDFSGGASIWALHLDKKGIMWVGGEGFGLRGYDLETNVLLHQFFSAPDARFINAITPSREPDSLWVASSAGLFLFNTQTTTIEQYIIPSRLGRRYR
jgi:Two component regulator propeller.